MAGVIATVSGVALRPGVSLNRRWYTAEMIATAVKDAQERIGSGAGIDITDRQYPLSQLTHHAAEDDSTQIVGRLTSMSVAEDGAARFTADLADTDAGRTIAALLDTTDGQQPFLKGVSIRGFFKGTVREVKGPDGKQAVTADGLELAGLDYTKSPGVPGAGVDTFAWVKRPGQTETTERVAITESVQEAQVTVITEETTEAAPADVRALLEGILHPPSHVLEDGLCVTCWPDGDLDADADEATAPMGKRGKGLSGAGRQWADPGYQEDGKQRYDISTKDNAKAAWSYIHQADKAKPYSRDQLKRIKGRIRKALTKFGVSVSNECRGWTFEPARQVGESVVEWMSPGEDARRSGSWGISASNGPVSIYISSYCMDPADLRVILLAAGKAAGDALAQLDPDMDGDVDVPGVGPNSDPDDDTPDEADDDEPDVTETSTDPASDPAAATQEEVPAVSGATNTPAAGTTPAAESTPAGVDPELYKRLLEKETRKLAKKAAREAFNAGTGAPATETAPAAAAPAAAAPAAPAAPAAETAPVAETREAREARLAALVDQRVAEAAAKEGLAVDESDEQIVARLLEKKLVPLRQAAAEGGGVQRKGLSAQEAADKLVEAATPEALAKATNDELKEAAGRAFGPKGTHR